jgi:hypothetical protein
MPIEPCVRVESRHADINAGLTEKIIRIGFLELWLIEHVFG